MRLTHRPATGTVAPTQADWIAYIKRIEQHNVAPSLHLNFDSKNGNLEFMTALNLADGLYDLPADGLSDEEYARRFLIEYHALFNLEPEVFTSYLVLKHTLHSAVGTHLIFDLRAIGSNIEDVGFAVHLDRQRRIVMITAAYDPVRAITDEATTSPALPNAEFAALLQQSQPRSGVNIERVWLPKPDDPEHYIAAWRFKYLDQNNLTQYYLIDQAKNITSYQVDPGAQPVYQGLGRIGQTDWTWRRSTAVPIWVVLRDLNSDRELTGRYVTVQDEITPTSPAWSKFEGYAEIDRTGFPPDLPPPPGKFDFYDRREKSSWFDRVMAYYHTDLVQRYFRELGLTALDDYPALNPVIVRLNGEAEPRFINNDQIIQLTQIDPVSRRSKRRAATQAREPRVIYHEFTHAVTDSLARLQRGNLAAPDHRRRHQLLQAAALDEGLADYFACSLAARTGATAPTFGVLMFKGSRLTRPVARDLGSKPAGKNWLRAILQPDKPPSQLSSKVTRYVWGELWGKFLWLLRSDPAVGADAADRLIATSLFFLTRWSTIIQAISALMLADQLLFAGVHRSAIQSTAAEGGINLDDYTASCFVSTLIAQSQS